MSTEEQPPQDTQAVVTSSSSFEIVHQDDDNYTVQVIPSVQDKCLEAPFLPHNLPGIWSDDDDEPPLNTGTTDSNLQIVTAEVHDNINTVIKASIEADSEGTDNEDADDEDKETERCNRVLRKLAVKCESVNFLIAQSVGAVLKMQFMT